MALETSQVETSSYENSLWAELLPLTLWRDSAWALHLPTNYRETFRVC